MTNPPPSAGIIVDTVRLSSEAAGGLSMISPYRLGVFERSNDPSRMAFVAEVLAHVEDLPAYFPKGKWATIQHIKEQVRVCAQHVARGIVAP